MNSMYRNCKYSEEFIDPKNNLVLFYISLTLQTDDKSDIDKIQLRVSSPKLIINKLRDL